MIKIVDFIPEHATALDAIGDAEWNHTPMLDDSKKHNITKVAIVDGKVVGTTYGKKKGDLFLYDVILIDKNYRVGNVAMELNQALLGYVKSLGCKNCVVKSMLSPGRRSCSATALKRQGFREILRVEGYWSDEPEICKVCGYNPCKCTCIFMLKEL